MRARFFSVLLLVMALTAACAAQTRPIAVKVVVVAMFEVGADTGDAPGELQYWVERDHLDKVYPLAAGYHAVRMNGAGEMAVLTGQPASSFSLAAESPEAVSLFNTNAPAVPVGIPSNLLERRPDIAAAERGVAQANAQIGVAKAAFYPNVTLAASAGFENLSLAQWLTWPSRVWSVGPSLAETIFDAGLRRATVQQFQAAYDQTVANYRQTVLTAFQQVEDNLAALRVLSQVIAQQNAAIQSAARNLREADVRYQAGLDPYLNVLSAQTILLSDQQTAVNFRMQQRLASVQLVQALGGGWDASKLPQPADLAAKR